MERCDRFTLSDGRAILIPFPITMDREEYKLIEEYFQLVLRRMDEIVKKHEITGNDLILDLLEEKNLNPSE